MAKTVAIVIWLAGMAVIAGLAATLARRARPADRPGGPEQLPRRPGEVTLTGPGAGSASSPVSAAAWQALVFLVVVLAGAVVIFGVMALLGQLARHGGPAIDKPIYRWLMPHRWHAWQGLMNSLTKMGDAWSTRMAAAAAAVCLAVTWRRHKWLPAFAFVILSVLQRYLTHAIHLVAHRVGPPAFPHGTFPSGGSERTVVFFGLIAYFLWREFSGRRVTAVWAGAAVAALAFTEGYSRDYLGMHWTTDVLSGWFYGILLLALFILASRVVLGPARPPAPPGAETGTETVTGTGTGRAAARSWPLVSVIIPTRGRPGPVRAAITAVTAQTYPGPIECLVVHDQEPPDDSLTALATADRQVRVLANRRTPGLPGARNSGLAEAAGQLIASCDDDDVWHPAKLAAQVELLTRQPSLLVVGSGIRLVLPAGQAIDWPARADRISHPMLLRNRVKELHSSTLVAWRDAYAKAGWYDEQTPHGYAEDYDWILRVARVGRIGAVRAPLADIAKDRGSWWPGNAAVTAAGLEYLLARHPELRKSARGHARVLGQIAFSRSLLGQRGRALRCAALALARWPASPHGYLALAHVVTGVDRKHVLRAARLAGRGLA